MDGIFVELLGGDIGFDTIAAVEQLRVGLSGLIQLQFNGALVQRQVHERRQFIAPRPLLQAFKSRLGLGPWGVFDEGIALSRWSLVSRDISAGRLVRPVEEVVKADWSHYFVAPPQFFDLPKVADFRNWLVGQCDSFASPE